MNLLASHRPSSKRLLHSFADILLTDEPKLVLPKDGHTPAWLWLSAVGTVALAVFVAVLILHQPLSEWLP